MLKNFFSISEANSNLEFINKKGIYILSSIVCLSILSLILYRNTIFLEPSFIHVWAQTDRYALALGFLNNGFDFFHPQTYTLDLQFPAIHELKVKEGITRVDFPIHEYLIALIMKLTGSKSPFIFRLYILLYSWIGMIFLGLFVQRLCGGSWIKGLFIMIFAFTAPVFAYYQSGFLPTIPSIADAFIAFYFYLVYKDEKQPKHLYISILFFTLAALSRTPFSILLIAFFCEQILYWIKQRKIFIKELIAFIISFSFIGGYFLYNNYLGKTYGSVFLSHPLPAGSLLELKEIAMYSLTRWRFDYFSKYHFAAFALLTVVMIITSYKKEIKFKHLLIFIVILLLGEVMYASLMIKQYPDHDYYFLDTFYIVVILLISVVISRISLQGYFKIAFSIFLLIAVCAFTFKSNKFQKERYSYLNGDYSDLTRRNFDGSEKFLDSLGISSDARILVIGSFSYNIPFVKMNRKGYAVLNSGKEYYVKALNEKFDYIVIQDQFLLNRVISYYPEIINKIEKVAGNGKITLYKKADKNFESIESFIGFQKQNKMKEYNVDYDTLIDTIHWSNVSGTDKISYSGKNAGLMSGTEFGLTYSDSLIKFHGNERVYISFETALEKFPANDIFLIASIENASGILFYNANELRFERNCTQWKKQLFEVRLPVKVNKDELLKIYLWNPGKEKFYYDDFRICFYEPSK